MSQNDTFKFLAAMIFTLFSFGASANGGTPWSDCVDRNMAAHGSSFTLSMQNIKRNPKSFARLHLDEIMVGCKADSSYLKIYDLGEAKKSKVQQQVEEASDEASGIREG